MKSLVLGVCGVLVSGAWAAAAWSAPQAENNPTAKETKARAYAADDDLLRVKVLAKPNRSSAKKVWNATLLSAQRVGVEPAAHFGQLREKQFPLEVAEHQSPSEEVIVEWIGARAAIYKRMRQWEVAGTPSEWRQSELSADRRQIAPRDGERPLDEVRTLVDSGPVQNRIDLVFMGDGYTQAERERFFEDMERLVDDLFSQNTFSAYLPLFNVHAVFRASAESGIGRGGPIDTAYGLYRPGETLRGIFPTNRSALRRSCAAAPDCDYPVVVANSEFYGGLGGEFAITTRSLTSGTMVLRHELGHNFGSVGEEYDGGGYFGANNSSSLERLGWPDWVTTAKDENGQVIPADMSLLAVDWPWERIDDEPFVQPFTSQGNRVSTHLRMSLSGLEGPGAFQVLIDGSPLEAFTLPTNDRSFVDFLIPQGLAAGNHTLTVEALRPDGDEYLSSFAMFEYGFDPEEDPEAVGAFPVFGQDRRVAGYRPTNEACLMRNMRHPWFCVVCQENNWRELLKPLRLYDDHQITVEEGGDGVIVSVSPLPLGQFRTTGVPRAENEHLELRWFLNGRPLSEGDDQVSVRLSNDQWARGSELELRLAFRTDSVRKDLIGYTESVLRLTP